MKQFMTLSAFFLSAACICANTQSFASNMNHSDDGLVQSTVNQTGKIARDTVTDTEQATKHVGEGAENVLNKAGKAIDGVARGISKATTDSFHAIEKGTKDVINNNKHMHHKSVSKKNAY